MTGASGQSCDVCVVGAGPAGIAVALRAAKLGHRVVLLEAADAAGGAMRPRPVGDLTLDDGRGDMLLPAALRDLFRKSGRPLERELELTPVTGVRTVRQSPTERIDLPLLGRGVQRAAVAERFGEVAADGWTSTLDRFGRRWDAARRLVENEPAPRLRSIGRKVARELGFPRHFAHEIAQLRAVPGGDALSAAASYPLRRDGHDPEHAPAVLAALPYLEQNLGRWHPAGGAGALLDVMIRRLALRTVDLRTDCRATGLVVRNGAVTGVRTGHGDVRADVVVSAVGVDALLHLLDGDLGRLARRLRRVRPAAERRSTFLRVRRELVPDAYETLLPGRPWIVARGVPADVWADPDGNSSWVCLEAATPPRDRTDLVAVAARRDLDLTPGVLERHDLTPVAWGSGAALTGWRVFGRLSPVTPLPVSHGLLVAGHASYLPAGLPTELLSGALAAAAIDGAAGSDATTLA
ncbi:MAG TPA: FAD-dependent oxidoreductase [Actinopolymorphaceae bacterium]